MFQKLSFHFRACMIRIRREKQLKQNEKNIMESFLFLFIRPDPTLPYCNIHLEVKLKSLHKIHTILQPEIRKEEI